MAQSFLEGHLQMKCLLSAVQQGSSGFRMVKSTTSQDAIPRSRSWRLPLEKQGIIPAIKLAGRAAGCSERHGERACHTCHAFLAPLTKHPWGTRSLSGMQL